MHQQSAQKVQADVEEMTRKQVAPGFYDDEHVAPRKSEMPAECVCVHSRTRAHVCVFVYEVKPRNRKRSRIDVAVCLFP